MEGGGSEREGEVVELSAAPTESPGTDSEAAHCSAPEKRKEKDVEQTHSFQRSMSFLRTQKRDRDTGPSY